MRWKRAIVAVEHPPNKLENKNLIFERKETKKSIETFACATFSKDIFHMENKW